jgi:hypothetical protein
VRLGVELERGAFDGSSFLFALIVFAMKAITKLYNF